MFYLVDINYIYFLSESARQGRSLYDYYLVSIKFDILINKEFGKQNYSFNLVG